jgi:opacity protein-like surface antigen
VPADALLPGIVIVTLAAGGSPAIADDATAGWYVMPSYHQTGLDDANNEIKQPSGDVHLNSSFGDDTGPGLAVGYAFDGPYRVDVEYQSHSNDLKLPGTILQSSSLDATTFVANVWRDFRPWHNLRPYAGVGFGGGTLKLNDLDGDFLFGQLGIGVAWYFAQRAALDIGYRYQMSTSNPELNGNAVDVTTEYLAQSAQIGIRFDLGTF